MVRPILFWGTAITLYLAGFLMYLIASRLHSYVAIGFVLVACGLALASSIMVAFPIAHLLAKPFSLLYFPEAQLDAPAPLYSRAEALVKKGEYRDALEFYEELRVVNPQDTKLYVDMIDVFIMCLADRDEADRVLKLGLEVLEDERDREYVRQMHKAISSRLDKPKEWAKSRAVSYRKRVRR